MNAPLVSESAPPQAVAHFASFAALRAAHSRLLEKKGSAELSAEFLDDVRIFIIRGQATGKILSATTERAASQSLLDYWATVISSHELEAPDAALLEYDPTCNRVLADEECPYFGLRGARLDNAAMFFGRDRAITQMLRQLEKRSLLVISGNAGSGKTSLVRAGLVPKISGSLEWNMTVCPGVHPLRSLAGEVAALGEEAEPPIDAATPPLPAALAQVLADRGRGLILVDRAEELFTLCSDAAEREAFVHFLDELSRGKARHRVILSIREEHLHEMEQLSIWAVTFASSRVPIPAWTNSELHDVIAKPAEQVGLKFESGLLQDLVKDLSSERDPLPLLQFAMGKLWAARVHDRIPREAYRAFGSCRRVLTRELEQALEAMPSADAALAEGMLLRMVRPGNEEEFVAVRARRDELLAMHRTRASVVLETLRAANVVRMTHRAVPGEEQICLTHHAFLAEEGRLRRHVRLRVAAMRWNAEGRSPEALLHDAAVIEKAQSVANRNQLEDDFLEASVTEREAGRRYRRNVRRGVWGVVVVAIVALAFTVIKTKDQSRQIESTNRQLTLGGAELRKSLGQMNVERGVTAAMQNDPAGAFLWFDNARAAEEPSIEEEQGSGERRAVHRARIEVTTLQLPRLARLFEHKGLGYGELSREGKELVSVSRKNGVRVWSLENDRGTPEILAEGGSANWAAISADARFIVTTQGDYETTGGAVKLWGASAVAPHRRTAVLSIPFPGSAGAAAINSQGTFFAAGLSTADGKSSHPAVWETSGEHALVVDAKDSTGTITSMGFSEDGGPLFVLSEDPRKQSVARIWNVPDLARRGEPVFEFPQEMPIKHAGFSRDGRQFVMACGRDPDPGGEVVIRILSTGAVARLRQERAINWASFSPDGRLVATASDDATARIWDAASETQILSLPHEGRVYTTAFSPDGRFLATSSRDQFAHVWDLGSGEVLPLLPHGGTVTSAVFSADGRLLVTASRDLIRVWDMTATAENAPVLKTEGWVNHGAFNSDRSKLVTGEDAAEEGCGVVRLWDAIGGGPLRAPLQSTARTEFVAISPSGDQILSAGGNKERKTQIEIWSVEGNASMQFQSANAVSVSCAEFSADGRWAVITCRSADLLSGEVIVADLSAPSAGSGDKERRPFTFSSQAAHHATFSADSQRLLVATGKIGAANFEPPRATAQPGEAILYQLVEGRWKEMRRLIHEPRKGDPAPNEAIVFGSFDASGNRVVTASSDDTARIWDLSPEAQKTGAPSIELRGHTADLTSAIFSPKGGLIVATTSHDSTARLWDAATGMLRVVLPHYRTVNTAAFSPDGKQLATGSFDRTARVWDVTTGEPLTILRHSGDVQQVAFSDNGRKLFSINYRQLLKVRTGWMALPVPWKTPEPPRPAPDYRFSHADGGRDGFRRLVQAHQWELASSGEASARQRHLAVAARRIKGTALLPVEETADVTALWNAVPAKPSFTFDEESAAEADFRAADACEAAEQWSAAVWHYSRLLQRKPDAAILARRAVAYSNLREWEAAREDATQALGNEELARNEKVRMRAVRGRANMELALWKDEAERKKAWDQAIGDFSEALKAAPEESWFAIQIAEAYLEMYFAAPVKQRASPPLQEAARQLGKALKDKPNDASLWQRKAVADLAADDRAQYEETCSGMMEKYRTDLLKHADPGRVVWPCLLTPTPPPAVSLGELLDLARIAEEAAPHSPYALNTSAAALLRNGYFDLALQKLEQSKLAFDKREQSLRQTLGESGRDSDTPTPSGRRIDSMLCALAYSYRNQPGDAEKSRQAKVQSFIPRPREHSESRYLWTELELMVLKQELEKEPGTSLR